MSRATSSLIFFSLTIVCAFILLMPEMNYIPLLASGDHGRDLYAFAETLKGKLPYRDYWWVYGPLMPQYYGVILKLLGVSIKSVLLGSALLHLSATAFIYLILALFITPVLSFLGALWFLVFQPNFFFTFNHIGGLTTMLIIVYCIALYLKNKLNIYLYLALAGTFILCLIKVNFGLTMLVTSVVAAFIFRRLDKTGRAPSLKGVYITAAMVPLAVFGVYYWLMHPLPLYYIRQCLPYLSADHPNNTPIIKSLQMLSHLIFVNVTMDVPNFIFACLIWLSIIKTGQSILKKDINKETLKITLCALGLCGFLYVINLHEFMVSGVLYRSFWAKPFSTLMMFILIGYATHTLHRVIRYGLSGCIALILVLTVIPRYQAIAMAKMPTQYFAPQRARVYIGNSIDWNYTFLNTVNFLKANLRDDEKFFALPYDPLHYFLMGQSSPTRELIFFDHINIPPQQERIIIDHLQNNNVNWVILSNRFDSKEVGLGTLGATYCPLLGDYLKANFNIVMQFGDWIHPSGWAWNYGVRILKRK